MKTYRTVLCLTCVACASIWTGCKAPMGYPAEYGQILKVMADKIADEGVLKEFQIDANANIQNPGVEVYAQTTIGLGTRIVGVNGQLASAAGGDATRLPAGLRESLINQLDGPLSDEQRAGILAILGWNRGLEPPPVTP